MASIRLLSSEMAHWQNSVDLTHERAAGLRLRIQFQRAQEQLRDLRSALRLMEQSKFWKLRNAWFAVRRRIGLSTAGAPDHSRLMQLESPELTDDPYTLWRTKFVPRQSDIERMRLVSPLLARQPKISILMPTYNTQESMLRAAIESVIEQAYPNWELCIADDASTDPNVARVLDAYQALDARIKVVYRSENGHISRSTNSALEIASGDYVGLLDHDDLLTPDALFEVACVINADPTVDMIYSDEDKVDENGRFSEPYFKPDWCPDSLLGRMYTCHFGVYRRETMVSIGGFRPEFDGSQDYDLVLRMSEVTDRIHHIPRVLYHWRRHNESAAANIDAKSYAYLAGKRAIEQSLERRGEPAKVIPVEDSPGSYVVRFDLRKPGLISIIIPTRDHGADVDQCLSSIFSHDDYNDFEVLIVDNGSTDQDSLAIFSSWERRDSRVRVLRYDIPFNFSKLNNKAAAEARGDYLLFLNNDTEVITADWLRAMLEWAQRPSIGAVGAKLYFEDGSIQHAGIVMGIGGVAGHSHKHFPRDARGYFNVLRTPNNYSGVTAACMMIRKNVFEEIGCFDETLAVAFNDVDLCLRICQAGYKIVCLPNVELFHYESKSRGADDTAEKTTRSLKEQLIMQQRWSVSGMHDPCYSDHLSLTCEDYSIRL